MEYEPEVGFVKAHSQCAGGNQSLHFVGLESLLEQLTLSGIGASGVGINLMAGVTQQTSSVLGRRNSEGIDDAASGEV